MTKKDRSKERMLPGDFQKKIKQEKYGCVDNKEKEIEFPCEGFFKFPEDVQGDLFKDRDFLVFYFDDEEEYEMVRDYFEDVTAKVHSHPELFTSKLVQLVKNALKEEGK